MKTTTNPSTPVPAKLQTEISSYISNVLAQTLHIYLYQVGHREVQRDHPREFDGIPSNSKFRIFRTCNILIENER